MSPTETPNLITLETARIKLARLWLMGGGLILLLIFFQSTFGNVYVDHLEEVWSWILPTLIPTLSLIVAVMGANALNIAETTQDQIMVRRSFYTITLWLSLAYLFLILATLVATRFPPEGVEDPLAILRVSHF
jgi:hypothetical protein